MSQHVIVWDLETVLDLTRWAAANELAGRPEHEIREAMGSKFPKLPYHSIACIGALIAPSVCMGETEALVPRRQA